MVMKKKNIILTVCVAVAMTFSLPSQAQRLIPKQRGIEVVGSVPLIKGEKLFTGDNFGVGISLPRLLYGGISALGGYEQLNEDKKLLPDGATLLDRSRFVYGGAVHGSVEVFLTNRILFLVKVQGRFLFGTDVHRFRPALSAGFRFNL